MTDLAAIAAQLVDMRNVGTHKSLRLTIHVPEEQALKAIEAFGWPTGSHPVPVALARLTPDAADPHEEAPAQVPVEASSVSPRPARKSYAQECAINCGDPLFHAFLTEKYAPDWPYFADDYQENEEIAAALIRSLCQVDTRAAIIQGTPAGDKWRDIYTEFRAWQLAPKVGAG